MTEGKENLQWTRTEADSRATRAAIHAAPVSTLCTWINQPLTPSVETEADMLLRFPPPKVHPPFLCENMKGDHTFNYMLDDVTRNI